MGAVETIIFIACGIALLCTLLTHESAAISRHPYRNAYEDSPGASSSRPGYDPEHVEAYSRGTR